MKLLEKYINRLVEEKRLSVKIDGRPIDLNYVITGGNLFQMCALNFISDETKQAIIADAVNKMRADYDNRMDRLEQERQKAFNIRSLNSININIWDDYPDNKTNVYVEESDVPLTFQKVCLEKVRERLQEIGSIKCELKLHDSADEYPGLIASDGAYSLFRRWEILISPVNEDVIDKIVLFFKTHQTKYEGIPFDVYSES